MAVLTLQAVEKAFKMCLTSQCELLLNFEQYDAVWNKTMSCPESCPDPPGCLEGCQDMLHIKLRASCEL